MLSLISVTSLVTLVSTASLPISPASSPSATNNEMFQDSQEPSLSLLPASRNHTSDLNSTSTTTNTTSLGIIYPPGFPDRAYNYHVPNSQITLNCWGAKLDPHQNARNFNLLFDRVYRLYNDPRLRYDDVWSNTRDGAISWTEGDTPTDASHLVLYLRTAPAGEPDSNMTCREFAQAVTGLNRLRRSYPMLEFHTYIFRKGTPEEMGYFYNYSVDEHGAEIS